MVIVLMNPALWDVVRNPTAILVQRICNYWRFIFVKHFVLSVRSPEGIPTG
jgi:hypothetical protein